MGHTNRSQRIVIDSIVSELNDFKRSLREEDKPAYDRLLKKLKKHYSNISYTCSYNTWAIVLFSIMLEMENESYSNGRVQK